ncbi:hypothetical protein JOF53_008118 [Crossiella equi]|uniref:2'-5' RNA ligase family protein n=1 Tax=Crossiella equi TaxID=130796 RepID=A0ABS5ARR1_9PSEU|nr:2'-5' RNA ligase family protein [Crossiella equi]MBP2479246.1 hypothetical protein [Crossiella equi]
MPAPGTTALLLPLPAADPLLTVARGLDPASVRPGIPAHITLAYPFVPATAEVFEQVRALLRPVPPLVLTELRTTPGFVGVLAPEVVPLADAVRDRWPEPRPYGGRFGDRPTPHLTVALDPADAGAIAGAVRPLLPLRAVAERVSLVELTGTGWMARFVTALPSA